MGAARGSAFIDMLGAAQERRPPHPEILLWSAASLHPPESQTSECSDLLSRSRATFLIVAQRQPGKLVSTTPSITTAGHAMRIHRGPGTNLAGFPPSQSHPHRHTQNPSGWGEPNARSTAQHADERKTRRPSQGQKAVPTKPPDGTSFGPHPGCGPKQVPTRPPEGTSFGPHPHESFRAPKNMTRSFQNGYPEGFRHSQRCATPRRRAIRRPMSGSLCLE